MKKLLFIIVLLAVNTSLFAQSEVSLYKKGKEHLKQKEWKDAVHIFKQCLEKDNVDTDRKRDGSKYISYYPNKALGIAYMGLKDYESAVKYFDISLKYHYDLDTDERLAQAKSGIPDNDPIVPEDPYDFIVYQSDNNYQVLEAYRTPQIRK